MFNVFVCMCMCVFSAFFGCLLLLQGWPRASRAFPREAACLVSQELGLMANGLGSSSGPDASQLCDFGQIPEPLWAASIWVKRRQSLCPRRRASVVQMQEETAQRLTSRHAEQVCRPAVRSAALGPSKSPVQPLILICINSGLRVRRQTARASRLSP